MIPFQKWEIISFLILEYAQTGRGICSLPRKPHQAGELSLLYAMLSYNCEKKGQLISKVNYLVMSDIIPR